MAASPKRVSWDACAWIAYIGKEQIRDAKGLVTEDRYKLGRVILEAAEKGAIEIAISALCFAEVAKNPSGAPADEDLIAAFFEHDYILPVPLDKQVGVEARKLLRAGYSKLKPPDAVHVATAIVANVDEMHTYDDKLLALDGKLSKLDGTVLKICKPAHGGPPLPLLDPDLIEALTEPDFAPPPPKPAPEGSNDPKAGD